MKRIILFLALVLAVSTFFTPSKASESKLVMEKRGSMWNICIIVNDSKGNPVSGASVTVGDMSGATNKNGIVAFTLPANNTGEEIFAQSGSQSGSVVLQPYFEPSLVVVTLGSNK